MDDQEISDIMKELERVRLDVVGDLGSGEEMGSLINTPEGEMYKAAWKALQIDWATDSLTQDRGM
jgi:hypothetical protein